MNRQAQTLTDVSRSLREIAETLENSHCENRTIIPVATGRAIVALLRERAAQCDYALRPEYKPPDGYDFEEIRRAFPIN